jgi:Icc-related predicted phosphoesterase
MSAAYPGSEATMPFNDGRHGPRLRIAATGDIHCQDANREQIAAAFAEIEREADLALVAGDLTSHGTAAEAEALASAVGGMSVPVFAVLGNHDWHNGEAAEIVTLLEDAGVHMLERGSATVQAAGVEVGVVGAKGFVGGFAPHVLPDFGEPSLRGIYAEGTAEVEALENGLREIATCPVRLVVLHYSPIEATLEGEPREIFAFLGSDRLAQPIHQHAPDLVVHGHAHAGCAEGRIGEVPVYNVSIPVLGREFRLFELAVASTHSPIP